MYIYIAGEAAERSRLDSLLTAEKFFAQFTEDHFSDELLLEIDQLEQMKRDLGDDAERLKIIDDLISDAKRELANQLAS